MLIIIYPQNLFLKWNFFLFKSFRVKDLETDITRLRMENEALKKSTLAAAAANPMMSSVAKVIQPTATVSSVPVSGPSESTKSSFRNY